ncbi:MAG: hypothetical protein J6V93_01970 [Clostridia bacterium]|nr:hypothetical protein [Clostridia bacterium]
MLSAASCGKASVSDDSNTLTDSQDTEQNETVISANEISDKAIDAIIDTDFGGGDVIIATSNDTTLLPDDTGNAVNRKRYERMNMLEEKFNFKFVKRKLTDAAIFTGARNAHNAELYYADLVYTAPTQLHRYKQTPIAANIASLPFVTLDAPYFNKASMEQASADGMIYAAIGESNMNADSLAGVFFNKDILSGLTGSDLYSEVYSQNWTLERMTELARLASYSDGKATGISGTATDLSVDNFIDNIYYSANGHNAYSSLDSIPVYTPFTQEDQNCVDGIYELMYNKSGFTRANNARTRFAQGNSLFCVTSLSLKNEIADSDFDWGILPLPTYTAGNGYKTFRDNALPVTVVLSATPDLTRSGILLEAVNAASYGYVREAYFDECMYEAVRDNDTLNMLDYIIDGTGASFAYMFGAGINNLDDCTYLAARNVVKSTRKLEYYNRQGTKISELLTQNFDR